MNDYDEIPDDAPAEPSALLAPVKSEVIALNEDTPPDVLLSALERVKSYLAELKAFKALIESTMIESIKIHGPIVVSDTVKYVVGSDKSTKCDNVPAAVEALMGAVDGDFSRFCGVLSSNALKHGAAKRILAPEQYAEFFKVTTKETLDAKPVQKLLKLDEAFTR